MGKSHRRQKAERKPRKPLTKAQVNDLALAYVARFATSAGKLESYLKRKLRERGFVDDATADSADPHDDEAYQEPFDADAIIGPVITRFVEHGYVDDAGYAQSRASGLMHRGYGARRVNQALVQAGIDEQIRADVAPGESERRRAIVRMAKKRRFGPFAKDTEADFSASTQDDVSLDYEERRKLNDSARKLREKHLAALVRAGHGFSEASVVLDAPNEASLEEWIDEAREEEEDGL
jgi:regulatory protein